MNFLKKRLKGHKKGHIDDDDTDYIPPVPPHPDEIARVQEQQSDLLTCDTLPTNGEPLDLVKVITERKIDKEKEEWKFLEQLTAKVEETVTKTQSALEKLKDISAIDEIAKKKDELEEDYDDCEFLGEGESGIVAKNTEEWISFETKKEDNQNQEEKVEKVEKKSNKPQRPERPKALDPTISELNNNIINETINQDVHQNLLDDFGFADEPQPTGDEAGIVILDYENDYLDDPFDTSFVDISPVAPKSAILSLTTKTTEPPSCDPFDTTNYENAIRTESSSKPVNPDNLDLTFGRSESSTSLYETSVSGNLNRSSRYGSTTSIASIMSNPFLSENDTYTPTVISGTTTPFSGTATPKRRNSNNPFEQSPEDEYVSTGASAIAALTEDFCKAIEMNNEISKPFDPFATIHDDSETPKRSSLTINPENQNDFNPDYEETHSDLNDVFKDLNKTIPSLIDESLDNASDILDKKEDNLLAPKSILDYYSDLSDNEELSKSEDIDDEQRRSSAFQMELLDADKSEPPPRFDPLPNVIRKLELNIDHEDKSADVPTFFDPFETLKDSPTSELDENDNNKNINDANINRKNYINSDEVKLSIGMINDAFENKESEVKESANKIEDISSGEVNGNDNVILNNEIDPFDTSYCKIEGSVPFTDDDIFNAFETKFDQTIDKPSSHFDPFASPAKHATEDKNKESDGFDIFDPFATSFVKPPMNTPNRIRNENKDSFDDDDDDDDNFKVVINAKMRDPSEIKKTPSSQMPLLPPPPKIINRSNEIESKKEIKEPVDEFEAIFGKVDSKTVKTESAHTTVEIQQPVKRTESHESPQTPLFDDDTSLPLEEFPVKYDGPGWEMFIRHPAKKKLTGNRFWKKVFVKLSENSVIQLFNKKEDNEPFQELPLQPCYLISEISSQQYDQYGKIFTIKIQYIFYRERVGVRKGQIAKVMQGQITSVGSIAKLGMPLEHAPQVSQLLKLGSMNYNDIKVFAAQIEETFFRMVIHRDRALTYKTEELQVSVHDEYYVEQTKTSLVTKQLARVRIFLLAFINGMPCIDIGVNDITRQGKEVVGRHDIIPVETEEWIRLEACEFHSSVIKEEFEKESRLIKLHPPDACFFEVMRFRVRPPKHRELPLQVSANLTVTKTKVELRCEAMVTGSVSRKHGIIPCEDISIRIHIPECWIYFFRTEKRLCYGSVGSASRRPGKIKGIERLLGATQNIEPTMFEASAGHAKYEHAFHSLVWRIPRLPKKGQGAYTQQLMVLRLNLTSFDQIPEKFYEYIHIEFTMPSTTVSHAVVRSISVTNENPVEKFVQYLSKHDYKVEMNINFKDTETTTPATCYPPATETSEEEEDSEESD